jgi:hypothetical protein
VPLDPSTPGAAFPARFVDPRRRLHARSTPLPGVTPSTEPWTPSPPHRLSNYSPRQQQAWPSSGGLGIRLILTTSVLGLVAVFGFASDPAHIPGVCIGPGAFSAQAPGATRSCPPTMLQPKSSPAPPLSSSWLPLRWSTPSLSLQPPPASLRPHWLRPSPPFRQSPPPLVSAPWVPLQPLTPPRTPPPPRAITLQSALPSSQPARAPPLAPPPAPWPLQPSLAPP